MPGSAIQTVSTPISEHFGPFARLCQASITMGHALVHLYKTSALQETARFLAASNLYADISNLIHAINEEASASKDILSLAAPLALTYSSLYALYEKYSSPPPTQPPPNSSPEEAVAAAAMQAQAVEGLRNVSASIVGFAKQLDEATPESQDLDTVSPNIMGALYSAASNYAWMVRESGDENCQRSLDSLRHSLRRLGIRWRCAAEYLRILEGQEFIYAVGTVAS